MGGSEDFLDETSNSDLIEEVINRKNAFSKQEKESLSAAFGSLWEIPVVTTQDKAKAELIKKYWNEFHPSDLQKLFEGARP